MGFMDKLKSMGRMMTGGGAKVYMEVQEAQTREPFTVTIKTAVSDADLKINGVYLKVLAEEEVRVEGESFRKRLREAFEDLAEDGRLDGVKDRVETCELRLQVAGPQELQANEEYEWSIEVDLPNGAMPTFRGRNCDHIWRFFAGLDAAGNDPDTGWIEVEVR